MQCARPWKHRKLAVSEQETQKVDMSPISKNLQELFNEAADPEPVKDSGASASGVRAAASGEIEEDVKPVADGPPDPEDLFNCEAKDFITRESQFAKKPDDEDDENDMEKEHEAKAKTKAKAKAKAKAKSTAKAKGGAKASAKGEVEAEEGSGKKKGRPRKAVTGDDGLETKAKASDEMEKKDDEPGEVVDPEGGGDDTEPAESAPTNPKKSTKPRKPKTEQTSEPKATNAKAAKKEPEANEGDPKPIFARRYRPGFCVFAGKRWDAIKDSFELHIESRVRYPSTVSAPRRLN